MIFSLYTAYKKHNMDKNWRSNQNKIASIFASAGTILLPTETRGKNLISKILSSLIYVFQYFFVVEQLNSIITQISCQK